MNAKLAEFLAVFFGFRKLLILMILFIVGIIFRLNDLINGAEMVDLFKTTAIAFMGANGVGKIVNAVRDHTASKTASEGAQDAADAKREKDDEVGLEIAD